MLVVSFVQCMHRCLRQHLHLLPVSCHAMSLQQLTAADCSLMHLLGFLDVEMTSLHVCIVCQSHLEGCQTSFATCETSFATCRTVIHLQQLYQLHQSNHVVPQLLQFDTTELTAAAVVASGSG